MTTEQLDELEKRRQQVMGLFSSDDVHFERIRHEARRDICEDIVCDDLFSDLLALARIGLADLDVDLMRQSASNPDDVIEAETKLEQLRIDYLSRKDG
jgi:hypothetical protein